MTAPLYASPIGLYDFQAEHIARGYFQRDGIVAWDTGLGKTHYAMALAALLFEDDLIDVVLVACEKNKVDDWVEDFKKFTRLDVLKFYGATKKRQRMMAKDMHEVDHPVLVSTYETMKNDGVDLDPDNPRKKPRPAALMHAIEGKRVLWVYDEATKLKSRTSQNHKAHKTMVDLTRKVDARVMSLTATPTEKDLEDTYNIARITAPYQMPTVAQFEETYVSSRDIFDNPSFQHKTRLPYMPDEIIPFDELVAPILLRKRKTDDDVRDQFPEQVEEFTYVKDSPKILELIEIVEEEFAEQVELNDRIDERALFSTVRLLSAWPEAVLHAKGKYSTRVANAVGEKGLRALGSPKTDRLMAYLEPLVEGQGAQTIIFTYFANTILPLLAERLREEGGYTVAEHHGGLSTSEQKKAKADFKEGRAQIFLTSDAGAQGLNLPEADYVVQYDLPLLHSRYIQRMNRNHRIDSTKTSVTSMGFIVLDTVEEAIANTMLRRNKDSDIVLGDTGADEPFISAAARRRMLKRSKKKAA